MDNIRELLENHELKIILESPEKDYRFEYYTSSIKERLTGTLRLIRAYRLIDMKRGTVTPNPWEVYDVNKQTGLMENLIQFGKYRIVAIVAGWEATCSACGATSQGKIWEKAPGKCSRRVPGKCEGIISSNNVTDIPFHSLNPLSPL